MKISYKGCSWPARLIKSADLSTGYRVYLLERKSEKPVFDFNPFVVAVKSPLDRTSEWLTFNSCSRALPYYINMLCCYA